MKRSKFSEQLVVYALRQVEAGSPVAKSGRLARLGM